MSQRFNWRGTLGPRLLRVAAAIVLLGASAETSTAAEAGGNHVIMITLDGMRPEFYLPGDLSKDNATLISLRDSGSYAKGAFPVYPSFTYPNHTAMMTGCFPARHGVTANDTFDPTVAKPRWFWLASDIKVPTVCDLAHKANLKVGAVSWPVLAGSKSIDWLFPEFPTNAEGYLKFQEYTSPGLLAEIEAAAGPLKDAGQLSSAKFDAFIAAAAIQIIQNHKPNLLLIHLLEADHAQHGAGRDAPELPEVLRRLDAHIHSIIEATKKAGIYDRTTFLILGDHGFADIKQAFAPNVLLAQNGLITLDKNRVTDWKAFVRNTGGSAGVYLKDPQDKASLEKVRAILQEHAVDTSGNRLYSIIEKDELMKLGGPSDAAFYLEGELGNMFSGAATKEFIRKAPVKGNHGYLPTKPGLQTGFVIAGRGIRKGVVLDTIRLVDVAPTIAKLLGLDMKDIDGRVLKEMLQPVAP